MTKVGLYSVVGKVTEFNKNPLEMLYVIVQIVEDYYWGRHYNIVPIKDIYAEHYCNNEMIPLYEDDIVDDGIGWYNMNDKIDRRSCIFCKWYAKG